MQDNFMMNKRIFILMNLVLLFGVVVAARFTYIFVFDYDNIYSKALSLWSRSIPIQAQRGYIYDRNGDLIVGNEIAPTVAVIPSQISDVDGTAYFLADILDAEIDSIKEHLTNSVSIEMLKPEGQKLTDEQAEEIIKADYDGVYIVGDTERSYAYGSTLSQVLGFTGIDNQGIAGIEYIYDDYLLGINGSNNIYTDAKGNEMSGVSDEYSNPTRGFDIQLTIDLGVQLSMERILDEAAAKYNPDSMMAMAMDVNTGEILSMVSYPSYDPSNYQDYDQETYNRNLPIWSSFEPGSTFKIVTYAAGLEEGVFELEEGFYDAGYTMVEGVRINDWKDGGHGQQTFLEVIQNSCNMGFIEIGQRLGVDSLFDYIDAFGFGETTGVDLLGESSGIVFDKSVVGPVELATSAFGQGNSVTPIQLVNAASAAVNGGYLLTPYILDSVLTSTGETIYENSTEVKRQVISTETSETMRYALENVVANGTGRGAYVEGYRIGGKTGTAQKVGEDGQYMDDEYIVSFLGISDMENPDVAVYVALDNPKNTIQYGGVVAAPIVGDIFAEILPILEENRDYESQIDKDYRYWIDTFYYEVPDLIGVDIQAIEPTPFYEVEILGDGDEVVFQIPSAGERIPEGGKVIVYTN